MRPVDQTILGAGGNCFAACLASVLEIPLDQVPDVGGGHYGEDEEARRRWARAFFRRLNDWLAPRGLAYFEIWPQGRLEETWAWECISPRLRWIGLGMARGLEHAVVMIGDRLEHDPHPARRGVDALVGIGLLVPLDAARIAP